MVRWTVKNRVNYCVYELKVVPLLRVRIAYLKCLDRFGTKSLDRYRTAHIDGYRTAYLDRYELHTPTEKL